MTDNHQSEPCSSGDDEHGELELDLLLAEYVDQLNAGIPLDHERIRAEHPEIAAELLSKLEAFEGIEVDFDECPPLGTLGDYTLRRQIGRGGMGVVYEAWESSLDRQVALKVLPAGVAADSKSATRFLREAQIAAKLTHPQIVPVFASGVHGNTPYYAMAYVEGKTLARVLSEAKDTPLDRAAAFGFARNHPAYATAVAHAFAEVADGVQHAHSRGIVHRDIKPSNLILDSEGCLRILDFGLAHLEGQDTLTLSGEVVGTPAYMSPEQARRRKIPVDHRTDVYSLGATLYETLTGRPPFRGRNHSETLSQIIERDPPDPRSINPHVPRNLETIVLKCLRKDPGYRYGTAEALAQDLRRFARGDPIEARPESRLEKTVRRLWRHRVVAVGLAALLLLVFTTSLVLHYRARDARLAREELYREKVLRAVVKIELAREFQSHVALRTKPGYGVASPFATFPASPGPGGDSEARGRNWSGTVTEAVEELREAMKLVPRAMGASYHLSRALRLVGKNQEARDVLDASLSSHPAFLPAQVLREELRKNDRTSSPDDGESVGVSDTGHAWAKHWLAARRAIEKGRRERELAVESYSALLEEISPDDAPYLGLYMEARLGRGRARLNLDDFDGAIEDFAAARERWPQLIEPALLLGKTYWRRGNEERAEQLFEALMGRGDARPSEVAIGVTAVFASLGEWDRGLAWAERIESPAIREGKRGDFLLRLDRLQEGREAVERAIEHGPDDAYLYYELGVILDKQEKFRDAAVAYGNAIERDDDLLAAHDARALARAKIGDIEGALADVRALLERGPYSADLAFLHHAYLPDIWSQGASDRALANWERVIELEPDHPWNYVSRGDVYLREGDYELARADYTRALEMESPYTCFRPSLAAYAFAQRGFAWSREGEHTRAIDDYTRAIVTASTPSDVKPNPRPQAGFYLNRADSRNAIGDFDGALEDYGQAIELQPRRAKPLALRGDFRIKRGDLDGAIADHEKAIEIDPKYTKSFISLGYIWTRKGDHKRVIEYYSRAIVLDPKDWRLYVERASAREALGETSAAFEDLDRAIEIQPQVDIPYLNRGFFHAKQGNLDAALNDYNLAVALSPGKAAAVYARGKVWQAKGEVERAIDDYTEAIRLDPKHGSAYYCRGGLSMGRGAEEDALSDFTRLIELQPDHVWARLIRAILLAREGLLDQAQRDVDTIQSMEERFGSGELYSLACVYSVASSKVDASSEAEKEYRTKAIEYLTRSIAAGWKDFAHIREDPDLKPIRELPEFKTLLEEGVKAHSRQGAEE